MEWDEVVRTAFEIVEKAKKYALSLFEKTDDELETGWDGVLKGIADLLELGLSQEEQYPHIKHRDTIFKIINFLCKHEDSTPGYEDLKRDRNFQGAGLVDVLRMIQNV